MAFKRSAVRSRLSPPLFNWQLTVDNYWKLTEISGFWNFIELLIWKLNHVPWKLNIVIMMQLWEGNSKGNFFSVSISKLRWVKIQFLAKKLLKLWACIIQQIENRLDYLWVDLKGNSKSRSLYKSKAQRKRVLIWEEEQRSGVQFSTTVGNGTKRMLIPTRLSYKERKGNALASGADEGRDKLR